MKTEEATPAPAIEATEPCEPSELHHFRLFVAGTAPKSLAAVRNLKAICETYLPKNHQIDVVDLQQHPELALGGHILAIPTLIMNLPEPIRRIIGDLSDTDQVMLLLGIGVPDEPKGPVAP